MSKKFEIEIKLDSIEDCFPGKDNPKFRQEVTEKLALGLFWAGYAPYNTIDGGVAFQVDEEDIIEIKK